MFPHLLALNATTLAGYDPWQALPIAARAGLKAVELTAGRSQSAMVSWRMTPREALALSLRLKKAGLSPLALGAHRDLSQAEAEAEFLHLIDCAAAIGCRVITTAVPDNAAPERFREGLYRAARQARTAGITLCLENHGYKWGTGERLLPWLETEGSLRLCYDTGNVSYYGGSDPLADLPRCVSRVGHLHLKDKLGGQGEGNFPALGRGWVDFKGLLGLKGWQGAVTASIELEFTPQRPSLEEAAQAICASAAYLQKLSAASAEGID